MFKNEGEAFFADPRHKLISAVQQLEAMGYTAGFAVELEFYLVDPKRTAQGAIQPPLSARTQTRMTSCQVYSIEDLSEHEDFIQEVIQTAHAQGIPADTVIAEYAPGQFEVNLHHDNDIVRAVDHAIMLKRVIRHVAQLHDMEATFMAKPYLQESGNGMHLHLSLMKDNENQFAADDPTTNLTLRSAIAGILSMADCMQAFLAPNINSYKRLSPESFAPTSKSWGLDNRTVALRIPSGNPESTRIEHRMAGADANPYLVSVALLAGVCEGIKTQLQPPAAIVGNAYEQSIDQVADNLRDALRNMQGDRRVAHWFGEDFTNLFLTCKWHDLHLFEQQITQKEYDLLLRYS
jgi:glutamine synthetase